MLVPRVLLSKLLEADAADLKEIAAHWGANMSAGDEPRSVASVLISNGWTLDAAMLFLDPFLNLARQMTEGDEMYLLME
jgi:hypothetical protein